MKGFRGLHGFSRRSTEIVDPHTPRGRGLSEQGGRCTVVTVKYLPCLCFSLLFRLKGWSAHNFPSLFYNQTILGENLC